MIEKKEIDFYRDYFDENDLTYCSFEQKTEYKRNEIIQWLNANVSEMEKKKMRLSHFSLYVTVPHKGKCYEQVIRILPTKFNYAMLRRGKGGKFNKNDIWELLGDYTLTHTVYGGFFSKDEKMGDYIIQLFLCNSNETNINSDLIERLVEIAA